MVRVFRWSITSRKNHEKEVSSQAMEACEHIITEMGAEIHDDLIQKLSILRLTLSQLERSQNDASESKALLLKMQGDFDLVTNTVRRISRRLIPVNFEGDSFHDEILLLCQNMEFPGVSNIHLEFDGEESNIPGDVRRYLYRIIQELIHNAFRHSAAWHIWVRLKWASTTLVIEVEDDGTAFAKETEMVNSLKRKYNTLRMRSQAIGADLRYKRAEKGLLARVKYEFGQ